MTRSRRGAPELPPAPFRIDRLVPDARAAAVALWSGGRTLGRVHAQAVADLGLAPGVNIDVENVPALADALQARGAYESGLRRLAAQAMARAHLLRRLTATWGAEAANDAVARLERYLDDSAFARAWVEARLAGRPQGAAALVAGLRSRGIPAETARAAVAAALPAGDAFRLCQEAARRYAARLTGLSPRQYRARLWAHLSRRGFDADTVERALADVGDPDGDDW